MCNILSQCAFLAIISRFIYWKVHPKIKIVIIYLYNLHKLYEPVWCFVIYLLLFVYFKVWMCKLYALRLH